MRPRPRRPPTPRRRTLRCGRTGRPRGHNGVGDGRRWPRVVHHFSPRHAGPSSGGDADQLSAQFPRAAARPVRSQASACRKLAAPCFAPRPAHQRCAPRTASERAMSIARPGADRAKGAQRTACEASCQPSRWRDVPTTNGDLSVSARFTSLCCARWAVWPTVKSGRRRR